MLQPDTAHVPHRITLLRGLGPMSCDRFLIHISRTFLKPSVHTNTFSFENAPFSMCFRKPTLWEQFTKTTVLSQSNHQLHHFSVDGRAQKYQTLRCVFIWKRKHFDSFTCAVHTKTMWKRKLLKTLSRMERFENATALCGRVEFTENANFRKRIRTIKKKTKSAREYVK